jgi:TolB-like protein/cytochrome c-type biogenesis protein CcmH/NrfG
MGSLIQGFEYDIFISYRQKDNKGERWVTEFVDALAVELEATFKERVSIYFDENPHDGLLENHDVDESLKEKLRCAVFVPIISQTYCDPSSFAWKCEFLPFIQHASNDRFGLKIRLPNGNVASRILPVRIHDLDADDKQLLESEIGQIRSIDFILRSAGINRPLRAKDDEYKSTGNHQLYRDQINKVANSIKSVIHAMRSPNTASPKPPGVQQQVKEQPSRKLFRVASYILLFAAIVIVVAYAAIKPERTEATPPKSIAVLPFEDMSEGHTQEWFADGLSDELISMLSKVPGLEVRARTSSFSFKGKQADVNTIAEKLNVGYLLEGSVRQSSDRIRVTATLIATQSGTHVWSETIEVDKGDILKLHDEIANAVVRTMKISLLSESIDYGQRQANQDALNLYLQGRYNTLHHKTHLAIQNYWDAIKIDPNYTKAYAGLTWAYTTMSASDSLNDLQIAEKRKQFAEKAYPLNPNDPEAIRAMSQMYFGQYEFEKCANIIQQGLRIEPNNYDLILFSTASYITRGQLEKLIAASRRLVDIDPLNYLSHTSLSMAYLLTGDLTNSENAMKTAVQLGPDVPGVFGGRSMVALLKGDYELALQYLNDVDTVASIKAQKFFPLYQSGKVAEAKKLFEWVKTNFGDYDPYLLGQCYAYMKDFDNAFHWFDRCLDQQNRSLPFITVDPLIPKELRQDPRYIEILKELKLDQYFINTSASNDTVH